MTTLPDPQTPAEQSTIESALTATSTRWVLASLSLSMLLSSLGTSIANVALPTLAVAFDATFQQVQWVVLAYLLAITTLIVSVGRLGDLVGRRRLLLAGIALFTAASVLCGLAPTLGLLIAARAAQGLGAAVMMALTMAFVGEAVPKTKTGRAMGLLGALSAVGTALGPTLGGLLIAGFGWQAIFFINAPLGVLALGLVRRYLPAHRSAQTAKPAGFDHLGTLLLALTLAAYALAMTMGHGHFGLLNIGLLLAALLGFALFVLTQAKAASPLVPLATFASPLLSAGFAMSALVTTVVMATLVVGPFYLSGALALDAARVGLVMSCGPLAAAVTGFPAGRLVDRFGSQRASITGLVAMALGCAALALLPSSWGVPGYIAPLVVITAGYALFQVANNTAVMTNVRPDQRGLIAGLLTLSRNLGLVTGASVMGAVFALAAGSGDITLAQPTAVASGMRATFGVAALVIFLALTTLFASALRARRRVHGASGDAPVQPVAKHAGLCAKRTQAASLQPPQPRQTDADLEPALAPLQAAGTNTRPPPGGGPTLHIPFENHAMKTPHVLSICCAAWATLSTPAPSHAAEAMAAKAVIGPYIGAAFGPAFGNREIDDSQSLNDEGLGHSAKLFGGYQLTEYFGVQAAYVRLRNLNQNTGGGATFTPQHVSGRSLYVAGTGRLPLGDSFALTGKAGVSFGKVTGASPATAATQSLLGSQTSLLIGSGAEFALNHKVAFSVELESYGQLSGRVKGNALTLGTRFTF